MLSVKGGEGLLTTDLEQLQRNYRGRFHVASHFEAVFNATWRIFFVGGDTCFKNLHCACITSASPIRALEKIKFFRLGGKRVGFGTRTGFQNMTVGNLLGNRLGRWLGRTPINIPIVVYVIVWVGVVMRKTIPNSRMHRQQDNSSPNLMITLYELLILLGSNHLLR